MEVTCHAWRMAPRVTVVRVVSPLQSEPPNVYESIRWEGVECSLKQIWYARLALREPQEAWSCSP